MASTTIWLIASSSARRMRSGLRADARLATATAARRGERRGLADDGEVEGRSLARRALHPDLAAHELGQPFADGEAEPGAAVPPARRAVELMERDEEPVQILAGDADARCR